jgi:hypothetical protein
LLDISILAFPEIYRDPLEGKSKAEEVMIVSLCTFSTAQII